MSKDLKIYKAVKPDGTWKNWRRTCLAEHLWPVKPDKSQNPLMEDLEVKPSRRCWQHELLPHTRESKSPYQAHRIWPQHLPWAKPALYFSWAIQKSGVFMITAFTRLGWNQQWIPKLKEKPCIDNSFFKAQLQYQPQDLACTCIWPGVVNQVKEHFRVFFQLIVWEFTWNKLPPHEVFQFYPCTKRRKH